MQSAGWLRSPSSLRASPVLGLLLAGLLNVGGVPAPAAACEADGTLKVGVSKSSPRTVLMSWRGRIGQSMAMEISDAFERHRGTARRFVLRLSSGGGSVAEGERVIETLRRIKQTHELETVVPHGQKCGSMCTFIYVQGTKRTAALASLWLFHEVSRKHPDTRETELDRARWERLVDRYFRPAGVSERWIAEMKRHTVETDYWQTGADLVQANSGIIHAPLGNERTRMVGPRSRRADTRDAPVRQA